MSRRPNVMNVWNLPYSGTPRVRQRNRPEERALAEVRTAECVTQMKWGH